MEIIRSETFNENLHKYTKQAYKAYHSNLSRQYYITRQLSNIYGESVIRQDHVTRYISVYYNIFVTLKKMDERENTKYYCCECIKKKFNK